MKFLVDVDGVVANFCGAVCKRYDIREGTLKPQWQILHEVAERLNLSNTKLWSELKNSPEFWSSMEKTPEAVDLMHCLNALSQLYKLGTLCFVTSTPDEATPYRRAWLIRHLGPYRLAFTEEKEIFVGAGILIDDKPKNVEKFKQAGGEAILYPNYWNSNGAIVGWPYKKEYITKHVSESVSRLRSK